jgi:hypothetical protein
VVYSALTGRVRWWLQPDSNAELQNIRHSRCEGVVVMPGITHDVRAIQRELDFYTGLHPHGDRYAIVPQGTGVVKVAGSVIADPQGCADSLPRMNLIPHPTAAVMDFRLQERAVQTKTRRLDNEDDKPYKRCSIGRPTGLPSGICPDGRPRSCP